MKYKVIFSIAMLLVYGQLSFAQCAADEVEIEVFVSTDAYGYEGYWEFSPWGSGCGVNAVASGGNTAVGCNGGGGRSVSSGGYGNNQTFSAGKWCVKKDSVFELHYIDDWGDGGFGFTIRVNGYDILNVSGQSATQIWTFIAEEPPAIDGEMSRIITPYAYNVVGSNILKGEFENKGKDTVISFDIEYTLDGGVVQSQSLTALSIPYGEHYTYSHSIPLNLSNGIHNIKVWCANINTATDSIPENDTLILTFEAGPGIPNIIDNYLTTVPLSEEMASSTQLLNGPTDLDFHPILSRKELWVINKRTEAIGGSTVTISNAGESNQTSVSKVDGNAWHFMSLPTGIAFGENGNFANSPGVFDANHNGGLPFTGPALWSSDPAIYAQPSGGNGSHLDMLHSSPRCQGIAHEVDNVYWVFDGHNSDIVRYDFAEDHGPGASYHGDAIVHRYRDELVSRDPQEKVVSHLVLDKATNWLYVVDYGNQRVIRLDITTGTLGQNSTIDNYEPVQEYKHIVGYTWETVVNTGLQEPAGIDIIDNRMLVSDYATGEVVIYDISSMPAVEMGRIQTSAQGIMGIKIGPSGNIWFVDYDANKLFQLKQSAISLVENQIQKFDVFPNPSSGIVNIRLKEAKLSKMEIFTLTGIKVFEREIDQSRTKINEPLSASVYIVKVTNIGSGESSQQRIIVQ